MSLAQNVESSECRCLKNSIFQATVLIKYRSGNVNGGRSTSDGSGIKICQRAIAGATCTGDIWIPETFTKEFVKFSDEERDFSEIVVICTVDLVA